jgi:hypothetical protein
VWLILLSSLSFHADSDKTVTAEIVKINGLIITENLRLDQALGAPLVWRIHVSSFQQFFYEVACKEFTYQRLQPQIVVQNFTFQVV